MPQINYGHAVYFEFHNSDERVFQALVCGYTAHGTETVAYRLYSRTISPTRPQTVWRPDFVEDTSQVRVSADGRVVRITNNVGDALKQAVEDFGIIAPTIEAVTSSQGWEPYMHPFVVQVGPLDAADMHILTTPKKLMDRVRRVREGLGWTALPAGAARGGR